MDFFLTCSPKFKVLPGAVMRKTVEKVATLGQVASIGGIEVERLLSEVAAEIKTVTGKYVAVLKGAEPEALQDRVARHEVLKDIIRDLHKGVDMAVLKKRFYELI